MAPPAWQAAKVWSGILDPSAECRVPGGVPMSGDGAGRSAAEKL